MRACDLYITRFRLLERKCIGNTNKPFERPPCIPVPVFSYSKTTSTIFTDIKITPFELN